MRWIHFLSIILITAAGLAYAQPTIANGGIVNGASFQGGQPVTPGSLISIFGTQLSSGTAAADSIPLSSLLGGVTVTFQSDSKTETAPLTFVQPSQINLQIPWDIVPSGTSATVNVTVSHDGQTSAAAPVQVGPFSPGIFSSNGRAIAVNLDGTLAWPTGIIPGLTTHPAKPGDAIIIYATGLGAVDSTLANGAASLDKLRNTLTKPIVMVGGVSASILFSGLTPQFVGVNQLNVVIPSAAPGDSVPLQLMLGGITTSSQVTIAVSQ